MHADNQCCYFYGSVPRNETNCVPEGRQIVFNFIVINPHDNFTNLTVKWFRNADVTRAAALTEEITYIQNQYQLFHYPSYTPSVTIQDCTIGPLHRDTFILLIYNFTSDNNGYYWCEIVVNGSVSQPSQYAWFYAADSSLCPLQSHFKQASIPACAEFQFNTYPTSITDLVSISTPETPYPSYTTSMGTSLIKPRLSKIANQSKSFLIHLL